MLSQDVCMSVSVRHRCRNR